MLTYRTTRKGVSVLIEYPMMLKAKQVSEILNVSLRMAYEIMERRDFPTIRIGKSKRVLRDDLMKWIEEQKIS